MNRIIALTDYKNHFGAKWKDIPYRSGLDKDGIKYYFKKYGINVIFKQFKDISFNDNWKDKIVIYTSSEEKGLLYKSYIEDIILGLERAGATIIPRFDFLRANNNKVYMEILRKQLLDKEFKSNSSVCYGSLEELLMDVNMNKIDFPCVVKPAAGSMSRGVSLSHNEDELIKYSKNISRSFNLTSEIKEIARSKKHKGYKKESKYQKKFIVQKFIPDLKNDWKILIFGNHYYVLNRGIKGNDFRASGSHYDYRTGSDSGLPHNLLDVIKNIYNILDVPHLSLDFAFDGSNSIVHEFQAVFFGTSTMDYSNDFFVFEDNKWVIKKVNMSQEEAYVWGLVKYFEKHPGLL